MRLTTAAAILVSLTLLSQGARAQDDEIPVKKPDSGSSTKATSMDEVPADEAAEPVPVDDAAPAPAPAVDASFKLDAGDAPKSSAEKEDTAPKGKFVGVSAPDSWHQRSSLGINLGLGSAVCTRDYCNSVIDVNLFGSITGTLGVFYRLTPNVVFFVDAMIGHINTNMGTVITQEPDKDNGTLFQPSGGAEFHLPVVGWFDPYVGLALGYSLLKIKADIAGSEYVEKWHGFNIEPRLGFNMYLWSTGFAKNLSLGAFMKVGFPVWPKMCWTSNNVETCGNPKDLEAPGTLDKIWQDTPFTLQLGVEARYHFDLPH